MLRTIRLALLAIGCLSLLGALFASELLVRRLLPRPGFTALPVAETGGVLLAHPERGHVYAPNLRRRIETPDYAIDFATNALGMRDDPLEAEPPAALRVLALGDSYTLGHGVQAWQAWPEQLERALPGSRVYNAGVSGYSPRQMRRTAELLSPRLEPHLLVFGLYASGYGRLLDPYLPLDEGPGLVVRSAADRVQPAAGGVLTPAFENLALRHASYWLDQHWYFAAHLTRLAAGAWGWLRGPGAAWSDPEGMDAAELAATLGPLFEELRLWQCFGAEHSIPTLALLINPQESDGSYARIQARRNALIREFAAAQGLCMIDPLPQLREASRGQPVFRFPGDEHWSAEAHALAADILSDLLLGLNRLGSHGLGFHRVQPTSSACAAASATVTAPRSRSGTS